MAARIVPVMDHPGAAPSFTRIAPYYDELMQDVPYGAWLRYVLTLSRRQGCVPRRILDLACGTGTLTLMLAELGFEVTGVDISEPMLQVARRKAAEAHPEVSFVSGDLASFRVDGEFDLAICLYDSLNNILEPENLMKAFQHTRAALAPGGLFIFDVNTEYALRANLFSQQNMNPDSPIQYRWESRYDYQTRLCTVDMQFWVREEGSDGHREHFAEIHRQRAYSIPDLERLLSQAGLDLTGAYNGLSFQVPHSHTDRLYCAARPQEYPARARNQDRA